MEHLLVILLVQSAFVKPSTLTCPCWPYNIFLPIVDFKYAKITDLQLTTYVYQDECELDRVVSPQAFDTYPYQHEPNQDKYPSDAFLQ